MERDSKKEYSTEEKGPVRSPPAAFYTSPPRTSQPSDRVWRSGRAFHYILPGSGNHWKECKTGRPVRPDLCSGWNSEIDSLLTFAGLFSAVVTAFTIESINGFSQLAGPGLLGIVCKQWLRRYQRDASLPHEKGLALHQFRYESFVRWKAVDILGALPLLLEIGLVLFFAGLIDFLQGLSTKTAIPIVIVIGAAIVFLAVTTMAPAFQYLAYWIRRRYAATEQYIHPPMFAFKSPQSRVVLRLAAWFFTFSSAKAPDWNSCDIRFISNPTTLATYTARGLAWLDARFAHSRDAVYQICLCMHDIALPVLRQLAKELINDAKRKRHSKPPRPDAEAFEAYAEQLLRDPGAEEAWCETSLLQCTSITASMSITVAMMHPSSSAAPISPALFYSAFKDLAITPELRWQKAMLLRTLLVQKRMHASSAVAAEAADVCIHHDAFSDEDLDSFFDAVYAWIGRDTECRKYVAQRVAEHVGMAFSSKRDSVGRFMQFLVG
ncbi:hypothetical protein BD779DRAFT_1675126 [Infundibulicybe gibba]|nr:hypothetical protein BD779DRAFT_1675126 [Infundibulicybe gibba]